MLFLFLYFVVLHAVQWINDQIHATGAWSSRHLCGKFHLNLEILKCVVALHITQLVNGQYKLNESLGTVNHIKTWGKLCTSTHISKQCVTIAVIEEVNTSPAFVCTYFRTKTYGDCPWKKVGGVSKIPVPSSKIARFRKIPNNFVKALQWVETKVHL